MVLIDVRFQGLFMLQNASCISQNAPLSFTQQDMHFFRHRTCLEIMSAGSGGSGWLELTYVRFIVLPPTTNSADTVETIITSLNEQSKVRHWCMVRQWMRWLLTWLFLPPIPLMFSGRGIQTSHRREFCSKSGADGWCFECRAGENIKPHGFRFFDGR